jgi:hypothetical protein
MMHGIVQLPSAPTLLRVCWPLSSESINHEVQFQNPRVCEGASIQAYRIYSRS